MSNESVAFICGMQKLASERGIKLETLVKTAGGIAALGNLLGKGVRGIGRGLAAPAVLAGRGAMAAGRGLRHAGSELKAGLKSGLSGRNITADRMAATRAAGVDARAAQRAKIREMQAQLAPAVTPPAAAPVAATAAAAPAAAPTGMSRLRGIFDTAKGDLGTMAGNARSGNWEAIKQQIRANPARWAGYGAGGAYAGGVGKDYLDLATDSDEFDYSPIGKLMMGLGIKDKPSVFTPLNPFHRNFSGFWG